MKLGNGPVYDGCDWNTYRYEIVPPEQGKAWQIDSPAGRTVRRISARVMGEYPRI